MSRHQSCHKLQNDILVSLIASFQKANLIFYTHLCAIGTIDPEKSWTWILLEIFCTVFLKTIDQVPKNVGKIVIICTAGLSV